LQREGPVHDPFAQVGGDPRAETPGGAQRRRRAGGAEQDRDAGAGDQDDRVRAAGAYRVDQAPEQQRDGDGRGGAQHRPAQGEQDGDAVGGHDGRQAREALPSGGDRQRRHRSTASA
jgi:hypothetical protein